MLPFEWTPGLVVSLLTNLLLASFSILVGFLARFQGPAKWYAVFGASFGVAAGIDNLIGGLMAPYGLGPDSTEADFAAVPTLAFDLGLVGYILIGLASLTWAWAIHNLVRVYAGRSFPLWVAPGLFVLSFALLFQGTPFALPPPYVPASVWIAPAIAIGLLQMAYFLMGCAPILLAAAHVRDPRPGQAILAAALCAYPISYTTWIGVDQILHHHVFYWESVLGPAFFLATAISWWVAREKSGNKVGLRVAWTASAALALGMGMGMLTKGSPAPIARAFDILLVGYAILRLRYLGLDVRLRWTLSKSSVAALFVGAFFAASELAQQFFGEKFNNHYLGIAAAGLLVVAIAPIQRWADRLAAKAVPSGSAPQATAEAVAIYRDQVATAWMDGRISANEKVMLRKLRGNLGLGVHEAEEIEAQAEAHAATRPQARSARREPD